MKMCNTSVWCLVTILLLSAPADAQVNAKMLRYPDVSETQITFVYAGDIWVAPKTGGTAHRLSSPPGEESFPRFSPDGNTIAFTGNYDGNQDLYLLPSQGGNPTRLTHHPGADRMLDWYPDGSDLLFSSQRYSGRQRFGQFYRVSKSGGLPDKLPVVRAEFGSISEDGKMLAYIPIDVSFRTWKRYRGGRAPDIWLFDLESFESKNITDDPANDTHAMWRGHTIYFLSDRGLNLRSNLWAYDLDSEEIRQLTRFEEFDVRLPSIGPSEIVFEAGGDLYLLHLKTEAYEPVKIQVVTDGATLKPRVEQVGSMIRNVTVSPGGKRAIFQARGELFSVPAQHGPVLNLTRSSGIAERFPSWSPDGNLLAYWTDRNGEYQLAIRRADLSGKEELLTDPLPGFRYRLYWSPDGRKLAFVDHTSELQIYDREKKSTSRVGRDLWKLHNSLQNATVSWSSDSRWLAFDRTLENNHDAIFVHDTADGKTHQVTSGFYSDGFPSFDPDGKYLYFLTNRSLRPSYSDLQPTWIYANTTQIAAVSLRKDVKSPLAPRNDMEEPKAQKSEEKKGKSEKAEKNDEEVTKSVKIDLNGFESRTVILPPKPGNYSRPQGTHNKVLYRRRPRTGSSDSTSTLAYYELKERKEVTVLENAESYQMSADGKKLLVQQKNRYSIIDLKPTQKFGKPMATSQMEMTVEPMAEWKQMFEEAWRLNRDYFYDPFMHQIDWPALRERYGKLLPDAVTRWDVSFIIGELIGELNASHTYRRGGDTESGMSRLVGVLGVDWSVDSGAYRIEKFVRGAEWDHEVRAPLAEPGVDVKEGDYVLAVNGRQLDPSKDPWSAFVGLSGKTVALTVNSKPGLVGAKEVIVKTLRPGQERRLRHLAWVESLRVYVDDKSGGRIGYIYVPDTGTTGQTELLRQYAAQVHKPGLIIDERFNSGGQLGDRFVELLNRPPMAFLALRYGPDLPHPTTAHYGPQAMLINGWAGSGGDALPWMYRTAGRGLIIGTRTWGGLIGPAVGHRLIDGGTVVVPPRRLYGPDGKWFAEGHGVEPDIFVPEDPTHLARGVDVQLDRAILEVEKQLDDQPDRILPRPEYENRSGVEQ